MANITITDLDSQEQESQVIQELDYTELKTVVGGWSFTISVTIRF